MWVRSEVTKKDRTPWTMLACFGEFKLENRGNSVEKWRHRGSLHIAGWFVSVKMPGQKYA